MKLLIDIGNTRIKWLCIEERGESMISSEQPSVAFDHKGIFREAIPACFSQGSVFSQKHSSSQIDSILVSNVAGKGAEKALRDFAHLAWDAIPHFAQVERQQCDIKNNYKKLSELGVDRWLAVIGARQIIPGGNIVVVNCGTAITVDWLDEKDTFQGGAILPGFQLASKALSQADGISSVYPQNNDIVVGNQTHQCVQIGIYAACVGGVESIVRDIIKNNDGSEFSVLLSGGAAPLFQQAWGVQVSFIDASSIEYKYDANVVMRGLSRVVECES